MAYVGRGLEQRSPCPHGLWGIARWHVEKLCFPSLEALGNLHFGFFYGGFISQEGSINDSLLAVDSIRPPPPPGNQGVGLKGLTLSSLLVRGGGGSSPPP